MHDGFGDIGALSLRTRKSEPLGDGQIRVAITVAGLNPIDWQIVESEALASAFGISTPSGFGNDFAGTVVEIGSSVNRWNVGDRVYGGARGAAVATSVILDEDHRSLHPTPDGISDRTAGVLDIAGRTASAVEDALKVQAGETVLVGAAGGGVGSVLTQLLIHAGARVIGTGSASSSEFIRSLGAEPVEYGPDILRNVRAAMTVPIAAAADLYGTGTALTALTLAVPPHRIVTIEADEPPAGVRAVNGSDARPDALNRLTDLIIAGELTIPISGVYSLENFAEAVGQQRRRHTRGKIAIET